MSLYKSLGLSLSLWVQFWPLPQGKGKGGGGQQGEELKKKKKKYGDDQSYGEASV